MQLTAIRLDKDLFPHYETTESDNALANLSQINIFIGANNSGKSRLMRMLFEHDTFEYKRVEIDSIILNKYVREYEDQLLNVVRRQHYDITAIQSMNSVKEYLLKGIKIEFDTWFNISPTGYLTINALGHGNFVRSVDIHSASIGDIQTHYNKIQPLAKQVNEENTVFDKNYIPILRGLRPIQLLQPDGTFPNNFTNANAYLARTVRDYFHKHREPANLLIDRKSVV